MTFRKALFWLHLFAGLISGIAIGIMCFTGTVLAFEKEIVAWTERDARQIVAPPAGATRLPLAQLEAKLRAAQPVVASGDDRTTREALDWNKGLGRPEARPMSIIFQNDPLAAVAFTSGRAAGFYVNPYTGDVREPQSKALGTFMHTMVDLHRYLGFHGEESRPRGKWINGVCNLAFCLLAVTGLYLWMPRQWSWSALRPVIWFRQNATGKARDFNWHNTIGFWCAPVLIVLTLTAVPISFQWGGRVIHALTGTPAPAPGSGPGGSGPTGPALTGPRSEAPTLSTDALLAKAQQHVPDWKTITLRMGGGRGGESRTSSAPAASPGGERAGGVPAATFTIRHTASWPRTASTTLSLNPYTGEVLRQIGYAELNAAQQVRAWTRFLHTGEAVGPVGQFVAGLACLGGVFLVWTGFALSWRRFFGKAPQSAIPAMPEPVEAQGGTRS